MSDMRATQMVQEWRTVCTLDNKRIDDTVNGRMNMFSGVPTVRERYQNFIKTLTS